MAEIEVRQLEAGETSQFEVTVREGGGESRHTVVVNESDAFRLAGGYRSKEEFVRECFAFLLEREPKESILGRFDVTEISRYFPEFETEIVRRAGD